ncbi:hypothetical protein QBC47DRAFT_159005 [Echria macrotheca]|uniref:Uncharacterized protein n=1 Tax=Echria macrotheca TaxID=438768 RepID=A0AAJ0BG01_9PEZI|nr:hypothetical protein QBC47DRAFT_159005 [Echria macrotheca]
MAPSDKPAAPGEPEPLAVVDTPTSPSSALALSRFEFETGKGNEGTKILMVEWDGSAAAQVPGQDEQKSGAGPAGRRPGNSEDWDVSWEGKTAVLHVRDTDLSSDGNTSRIYYLLPPGAAVPALITITHKTAGSQEGETGSGAHSVLRTKPMPAIFPAELSGSEGAGRRGVLHTIWAKKRLAELEAEIAAEMKENGESVGLEMAVQERQWIVDHFGLGPAKDVPAPTMLHIPQTSVSPTSPRSPIGGKLGEKLRGLKLATSPSELAAATQAAKSAPTVTGIGFSSVARPLPKDNGNGTVASLDAIVGAKFPPTRVEGSNENIEEDLFALPMSPRSPEMKRSPFSLL